MSDHVIVIGRRDGALTVDCSCGEGLSGSRLVSITLDLLTEIAHEHIELAERGETYQSRPAITSNDELIDLRNDTAWTGSTYGV